MLAVNPEPKIFPLRTVYLLDIAEHPFVLMQGDGGNLHVDFLLIFQAWFVFFKHLNLVSKPSQVRLISIEDGFLANSDCIQTWYMQSCTETRIKNKNFP